MVTIYGKPSCAYCIMAKTLCEQKGLEYKYLNMGDDYTAEDFFETFPTARTFPQIIVDDEKIGGYTELEQRINS